MKDLVPTNLIQHIPETHRAEFTERLRRANEIDLQIEEKLKDDRVLRAVYRSFKFAANKLLWLMVRRANASK